MQLLSPTFGPRTDILEHDMNTLMNQLMVFGREVAGHLNRIGTADEALRRRAQSLSLNHNSLFAGTQSTIESAREEFERIRAQLVKLHAGASEEINTVKASLERATNASAQEF